MRIHLFSISSIVVLVSVLGSASGVGAMGQCCDDGLVLRDLTVVRAEIVSFNKDHVQLANGKSFGWDEIHQGRVSEEQQPRFDSFLKQIGMPLFRVRHRLIISDWAALSPVVEELYSAFDPLETTPGSARADYLICLATMHSRLNQGSRVAAVVPFLHACKIRVESEFQIDLPTHLELSQEEFRSRVSKRILPIFFDSSGSKQQLPFVERAVDSTQTLGGLVYKVAMSISAKESAVARSSLELLEQRYPESHWLLVLKAHAESAIGSDEKPQAEQNPLGEVLRKSIRTTRMSTEQRAIAKYLLAESIARFPQDHTKAMIEFCQVAAICEKQYRHLAAAALYQAMIIADQLGHTSESTIIKRELLADYPTTFHGKLASRPVSLIHSNIDNQ